MTYNKLNQIFNYVLKSLSLAVIGITFSSCEKESVPITDTDFKIDQEEIIGSLHPWPLVDDPEYINIQEVHDISDLEIVLVYKGENQVYIYPTGEMTHVEIVNDWIDDIPVAITYCPLTKSGIAWRRNINDDILHFTPSGMLFHSNLLAYDFETKSIWSQMRTEALQGDRSKQELQMLPLLEIPWGSMKDHFPDALVYTRRNSFISSSRISTGQLNQNIEINSISGDRVFGIIKGNRIDIFPMELFDDDISILGNNTIDDLILVGSNDHEFIVAFETSYNMSPVYESFPVILKDRQGTFWNIFGEAVEGPRKGERLTVPTAYTALFWAWEGVFEDKTVVVNTLF